MILGDRRLYTEKDIVKLHQILSLLPKLFEIGQASELNTEIPENSSDSNSKQIQELKKKQKQAQTYIEKSLGFYFSNSGINPFGSETNNFFVASVAFDAELPKNPAVYFVSLAFFIIVSLFVASIIGLTVKDQVKTPAFSIALFLPSVMFSGIMFPAELLPKPFEIAGKIFPATWGFELLSENLFRFRTLFPLALIFLSAFLLCVILLKQNRE